MDDRGPPAALVRPRRLEGPHLGRLLQDGLDGAAQDADPLAVDDADAQDASLGAGVEVVPDQILDLAGLKRVEIQDAVDGHLDRLLGLILDAAAQGVDVPVPAVPASSELRMRRPSRACRLPPQSL